MGRGIPCVSTQIMLYFLVHEGRLCATYKSRAIVLTSRDIQVMFDFRNLLLKSVSRTNGLLNPIYCMRADTDSMKLYLTENKTPTKHSSFANQLGICQCTFDMYNPNSLPKQLFDISCANLFVMEDLRYNEDSKVLSLQGIHLNREDYLSKDFKELAWAKYLDYLIDQ